jgi:hypothetical protein
VNFDQAALAVSFFSEVGKRSASAVSFVGDDNRDRTPMGHGRFAADFRKGT